MIWKIFLALAWISSPSVIAATYEQELRRFQLSEDARKADKNERGQPRLKSWYSDPAEEELRLKRRLFLARFISGVIGTFRWIIAAFVGILAGAYYWTQLQNSCQF